MNTDFHPTKYNQKSDRFEGITKTIDTYFGCNFYVWSDSFIHSDILIKFPFEILKSTVAWVPSSIIDLSSARRKKELLINFVWICKSFVIKRNDIGFNSTLNG